MKRDTGKFPIYEMSPSFDSTLVVGPSRKVGTWKIFFKSCLSLAKDLDALVEIVILLYQLEKYQQDYVANSLHKKKTRSEMRMNV